MCFTMSLCYKKSSAWHLYFDVHLRRTLSSWPQFSKDTQPFQLFFFFFLSLLPTLRWDNVWKALHCKQWLFPESGDDFTRNPANVLVVNMHGACPTSLRLFFFWGPAENWGSLWSLPCVLLRFYAKEMEITGLGLMPAGFRLYCS